MTHTSIECDEQPDNKQQNTTNPDKRLDLNDVVHDRNHEELFLGFLFLLVPPPRVDHQVQQRASGDLRSTYRTETVNQDNNNNNRSILL